MRTTASGDRRTILHDHGAVRTVGLEGMGGLPAGQEAITRILRPLGYALHGTYPLETAEDDRALACAGGVSGRAGAVLYQ